MVTSDVLAEMVFGLRQNVINLWSGQFTHQSVSIELQACIYSQRRVNMKVLVREVFHDINK